ncbi:MAG: hypothetical protein AAGA96_01950 [Verrucomicrobiota bacterium]
MKSLLFYQFIIWSALVPLTHGADKEAEELAAWRKEMEANEIRQEESLQRIMAARVDELNHVCELDEQQLSRLRLAAKGAVEYAVDAYMNYEENRWRQRNGDRGPALRLKPEDQNPALQDVWRNTVAAELNETQKEKLEAEMAARTRYYADLVIRQFVQQFDEQTRMSARQRGILIAELEKSIPLPEVKGGLDYRSVQIAVYQGLAKVPDAPLKNALSDLQFNAWKNYGQR